MTTVTKLPDPCGRQAIQSNLGLVARDARGFVPSHLYDIKLEICEQIRPVRGWVIVACRRDGRVTQLCGVFIAREFAQAQALGLVARWRKKARNVSRRPVVGLSLVPSFELEWEQASLPADANLSRAAACDVVSAKI